MIKFPSLLYSHGFLPYRARFRFVIQNVIISPFCRLAFVYLRLLMNGSDDSRLSPQLVQTVRYCLSTSFDISCYYLFL